MHKVAKTLADGMPQVDIHNSLSVNDSEAWEAPVLHRFKPFLEKGISKFHCLFCTDDYFQSFDNLLLHILTDHSKFGHDLLTDLKHGTDVRRVR
jgi:hypothetical protein